MATPRDTFKQYVLPALSDCRADPAAAHRAVAALCNIDALAEEVFNATGQPGSKISQYRTALKEQCVDLAYAWDVHDIHKHGMLDRRTPVLPNGRRPMVVRVGGVFQRGIFQLNVFQTGHDKVVLTLEGGQQLEALRVVETCVEWWDAELTRLGWP